MTFNSAPPQDWYESTIDQFYDWGLGTIHVKDVPLITFPTGKKVYITIDAKKTTMQVVEVDGWDSTAKTMNVSSITTERGDGLAYTAQDHWIGASVQISDPYEVRKDIEEAIGDIDSGTVKTNSQDIADGKFADPTARDAYFTSPVDGNSAYVTSLGLWTDYIGGVWTNRATGSTPNADETTAGKVEEGTDAQNTAGTNVGETGAKLFITPWKSAKVIQSGSYLYAGASAVGTDAYAVSMTPALTAYTTGMKISFKADVANTGACSIDVNWLGVKAIKTIAGNDTITGEIPINKIVQLLYDGTNMVIQNSSASVATNAEATAGVDTLKYINSEQLKKYAGVWPTAGTTYTLASSAGSVGTSWSTFVVAKTLSAIGRAGTYTFTFDLSTWPWVDWEARIYKWGVAFGTLRSRSWSGTSTFAEDLTVAEWDIITIVVRSPSASGTASVSVASVKYNIADWKVGTMT